MLLVMLARDPVNGIRVVQVVRVEKVIVHPTRGVNCGVEKCISLSGLKHFVACDVNKRPREMIVES